MLLPLAERLRDAAAERRLEIGHGKLLLSGDGGAAVANLVAADAPAELSRRSGASASRFQLTINFRVQAEPAVLEELVSGALAAWTEQFGLRITGGAGQTFRPSPPVPTHRFADREARSPLDDAP